MNERIQVNMHEAQSQLDHLAERAWRGDTVVITKDAKPYLYLLPYVDTTRARKPWRLKGIIRMTADFERRSKGIIDGFENHL